MMIMMKVRVALTSRIRRQVHEMICQRTLVSITSTSTSIKRPATPTPVALERYHLSLRDINTPNVYIPLILFFSAPTATSDRDLISYRLKHSLSQTLTQYYPFAGRLTSDTYVDCHDQGAEFIETRVECGLNEILQKHPDDADSVRQLFPPATVWGEVNRNNSNNTRKSCGPLTLIQLNRFDCGGMAMAVCVSHRITDARGLSAFIKHWAAVCSQSGTETPPHFVSWPSQTYEIVTPLLKIHSTEKEWITKKFVFPNSKLGKLKAIIGDHGVHDPTRVEVLASLIYKACIVSASSGFSPSVLVQAADIRAKFKLPEHAIGNFFGVYSAEAREEGDLTLHGLNKEIKKGKMKLKNMESRDMEDGTLPLLTAIDYAKRNYRIYLCSSVCNIFGTTNNVDFGWGKPIKVNVADGGCPNNIFFMDTPGGDGIEAMVCLGTEEEMLRFQHDKDLLAATAC